MEKLSKSKREARGEKQREQKLEELVLKNLDECGSSDDKLKTLLQRHLESEKNVIKLQNELRANQRIMENQMREKEVMQREINKSVLMRDKLQEVCREQQRIIKSVKNESMLQIKVEEERRKESQIKFQSSINEITQSLAKNNEENIKLRDYNIEMTKKLKLLAEQYQTREKHLEKLNEQVQLEAQLHQAKLSKAQVEAAMEKEILTKENQIGLEKLLQAQRAIKDLTEREQQLKQQLNIYTAKYDEFQQSLQKSNDVFSSYKIELDKMSKHTKKIEKEALSWRQKFEKANAMVIELATEKQLRDQHADRCSKQVDQLQKLLRALQAERTSLHRQLRENNIEIEPMPALPPEPLPMSTEPVKNEKDKIEVMSRNCEELKQTLASLQNQMLMLTTDGSKTSQRAGADGDKTTGGAEDQAKTNNNAKKNNKKKNKSKAKAAVAAAAASATATAPAEITTETDDAAAPQKEEAETVEPAESATTEQQMDTENDQPMELSYKAQQVPENVPAAEVPTALEQLKAAADDDKSAISQQPLPNCVDKAVETIAIETATIDIAEVPELIDAD